MKTKLGCVIAIVEIASLAALLFLLRHNTAGSHAAVWLVFALPLAFGLHVFEEFVFPGGASDWFRSYRPQFTAAYTPSYFFRINALPLVLSLGVSLGAFDYRGGFSSAGIRAWLAFVCIQGFNAIYHIRGAIETRNYSPGMVSGILFYLPLAVFSFAYLIRTGTVDVFSAIGCLLVGAISQSLFDRIKERAVKKARK